MQKYSVDDGAVEGVIDNMTMINRLNDGIEDNAGHKMHMDTDHNV